MENRKITKQFLLVVLFICIWVGMFSIAFYEIGAYFSIRLERWPATLGGALLMLMGGDTKEHRRKFFISSVTGTVLASLFTVLRSFFGPYIGFYGVAFLPIPLIFVSVFLVRLFPEYFNHVMYIFFSISATYAEPDRIAEQTIARVLAIVLGGSIYFFGRRKIMHIPKMLADHKRKREESRAVQQLEKEDSEDITSIP